MENDKRKRPLSRVERREKRKVETTEEIRVAKTKANQGTRQWGNNQKIRVGSAILSEFKGKPEKMAELLRLLDSFYTKDYDRKYFIEWGLPPHHKSAVLPSENESGQ